jgi:hypothetical protein
MCSTQCSCIVFNPISAYTQRKWDNVPYGRSDHSAQLPQKRTVVHSVHFISQQHNDLLASKEARLQHALQIIKRERDIISKTRCSNLERLLITLTTRRAGRTIQQDCAPNFRKPPKTEKYVIDYLHAAAGNICNPAPESALFACTTVVQTQTLFNLFL